MARVHNPSLAQNSCRDGQFSLTTLLEYVTLCAICMAVSSLTGPAASVFLMLMALALAVKKGSPALAMLTAACMAADWTSGSPSGSPQIQRQVTVLLLAGLLCAWYRWRSTKQTCSTSHREFNTIENG